VLNEQVIAQCRPRHRHQEFLDFLRCGKQYRYVVDFEPAANPG